MATKPEKPIYITPSLPGGSWRDSARRIRVVEADDGNGDSSWILKADLRTNNWRLFGGWYLSAETQFRSGDLFQNDDGHFVIEVKKATDWFSQQGFLGPTEETLEEALNGLNSMEYLAFMVPPFGLLLVRKTNKRKTNITKTILSPFNHFFVISQGVHLKNALKLCRDDLAVAKAELKMVKEYRDKIEKDSLKLCQNDLAETRAELKMMKKYLNKIEKEKKT
jgi:hypothetical protein